jgi:hypothetical protein
MGASPEIGRKPDRNWDQLPLDHLPQAIPITTLSTDTSKKTSFSLLLLLGLRSKGQGTDHQRTPCQNAEVMKFPSSRPLTSFRSSRLLTSFHGTRQILRLLLSLLSSCCGNPVPYTPFQRLQNTPSPRSGFDLSTERHARFR